jgi:Flp pilus assembly protein TadD
MRCVLCACRGIALERLGRFEEAIQSLRAAVQLELSEQVAKALQRYAVLMTKRH